MEIDLILKGIKTKLALCQLFFSCFHVEIDLILKGIKTRHPPDSYTVFQKAPVEIDLILKGIKTTAKPLVNNQASATSGNRPDSQRD